jgi:hypothetical protein
MMMKRIYLLALVALSLGACAPKFAAPVYEGRSLNGLFSFLMEHQSPDTPRSRVYVVAHRANTAEGQAAKVPDNSLPGIELSVKHGVDMVELDVRTTKDGVLVLCHDRTIDASTTGHGPVADYTLDELRQFDMQKDGQVWTDEDGRTVKMPTLAEALEACRGRIWVNLDIKKADLTLLVKMVEDCGMEDEVMLFTGQAAVVDSLNPRIAIHPYIHKPESVGKYAAFNAHLFQYGWDAYVGANVNLAREVRARGGLTYSNYLFIEEPFLRGDTRILDMFIESETDFVQTNYPEPVMAYLRRKGLR